MDDRPMDPGRTSMPPPDPSDPTTPIRPPQAGTEPIPERVRQPIVVPHRESTIAGLPRALVVAAVVGLALAAVGGFFVGRSVGGDEEVTPAARGGRRAACARALTLSLQISSLQRQALENRTVALQELALGDEGRVAELNEEVGGISAAVAEVEAQLTPAVDRCRSGGGGGSGKGKGGKGGKGAGRSNP